LGWARPIKNEAEKKTTGAALYGRRAPASRRGVKSCKLTSGNDTLFTSVQGHRSTKGGVEGPLWGALNLSKAGKGPDLRAFLTANRKNTDCRSKRNFRNVVKA